METNVVISTSANDDDDDPRQRPTISDTIAVAVTADHVNDTITYTTTLPI